MQRDIAATVYDPGVEFAGLNESDVAPREVMESPVAGVTLQCAGPPPRWLPCVRFTAPVCSRQQKCGDDGRFIETSRWCVAGFIYGGV